MTKAELAAAAARNRARLAQDSEAKQPVYYEHDKPCRYCGSKTRYVGLNSCAGCVERKLSAKLQETENNNKCLLKN
ncbi:TPA: hypothetical protein JLH60_004772 [Escherichia coli]|nr:hypothetical protein [Escherichia coli]